MKEFAHMFMNDRDTFIMTLLLSPLVLGLFLTLYHLIRAIKKAGSD